MPSMKTTWKCGAVSCEGEAVTGWGFADRLPVLVCSQHRDELADRALAIPTEDGRLIVRPLVQTARPLTA